MLDELGAEIESLAEQTGRMHAKRVCELRASGRYGRYLRLTKTGQPRVEVAWRSLKSGLKLRPV